MVRMPRTKAEVAVVKPTPNALVASAARQGKGFKDYLHIARGTEWHEEAWNMYDIVGEYRYACDWVGGMLSKAILFATRAANGTYTKQTSGTAYEALDALFGDDDGRAEMLRLIGIHLTVTGDCWLVGYTTKQHGYEEDVWEIVASTRLRQPVKDGKYVINDEVLDMNPDDVLVIRLWKPHPRHSDKAVSPSKAALPILAELVKLTQHVAAQVDSRLASAGILLVPTEMNFAGPPGLTTTNGKTLHRTANSAEDLIAVIQDVASTTIERRGDPSSLVPIVISAPAEAIAAVKHLKFWTELDATAIELRNEAIRRLALSMDMPPEVLQGISEANHWSAWAVDESAIKAHTEPLLKIVTSSLAKEYLRPLIAGEVPDDEVRHYSIKADTTDLRVRPNRAKEALELYDRQELSGKALRRETGFTEDDLMDTEELKKIFTRLAAKGSTTPEIVEAALRAIGADLLTGSSGVPAESDTQEGRPAPSLRELPVRGIPDRERSERRKIARDRGDVPSAQPPSIRAATLIAASEMAVTRALERAGNRMKNKVQAREVSVPANMLYMSMPTKVGDYDFLLDDAWTPVTAIAQRHDVPIQWLKSTLDTYCRTIMANQTPHTYDGFAEHMTRNLEIFDMSYPREVTA